ncbi:hypothetical protein B0H16DRAFT_1718534 [Mycena metata]|uniref:Uncharacterized protein n=1 Tax=Mycena metata TaxID=1033252 RepID=A0AAD7NJD7_9AGAR|nr:hypothetical protein B0H16DRAFT_1718534 [Mycena metata]
MSTASDAVVSSPELVELILARGAHARPPRPRPARQQNVERHYSYTHAAAHPIFPTRAARLATPAQSPPNGALSPLFRFLRPSRARPPLLARRCLIHRENVVGHRARRVSPPRRELAAHAGRAAPRADDAPRPPNTSVARRRLGVPAKDQFRVRRSVTVSRAADKDI